ncbi:hypothetical protein [Clostridium sp.]|uniref:hypothetical protein n=1 Tax=Clostridium sp. TaxID=1506 RepID=UPI001A62F310|nr:hypothetical protein [Clostridium sp.]MBK5236936.1 hypothetical protein [Clostridium sp.]
MQPTLEKMIDAFNTNEKQKVINYIADYKQKSEELSYEEYMKWVIVFCPPHKWYIKAFNHESKMLKVYQVIVEGKEKLKSCKSFDEIITYIDGIKLAGFSELAKYDTAIATGIRFQLMPDKVFLHAGPRYALKYILKDQFEMHIKKLNNSKHMEYIEFSNLPYEFQQFKDNKYLVEDCLCYIYSKFLK